MKSYLIILHSAPFAGSKNLEALEFALALAAFEQPVSILLLEDSVLQLLPNKKSELIAQKDFTKAYTGIDLFGIQKLYASADAIQKFKLEKQQLLTQPEIIDAAQINSLLNDFDVVLNI